MLTDLHLLAVGDDLLCGVDTSRHKRLHSTAAGQHRLGVGKAFCLTLQAFFFVSSLRVSYGALGNVRYGSLPPTICMAGSRSPRPLIVCLF
jgi:hypothetical protein